MRRIITFFSFLLFVVLYMICFRWTRFEAPFLHARTAYNPVILQTVRFHDRMYITQLTSGMEEKFNGYSQLWFNDWI